jgi:hypothetical protein
MMRFNILFWEPFIREQFINKVELFVESIEKRLMPTFDSIEDEAETIQHEKWERLSSSSNEYTDPAISAENAMEAGLEYYEMMMGVRQGLLNILATALHHLFEQQIILMLRREILPLDVETNVHLFKVGTFMTELQEAGIDIAKFSSWEAVTELKLVSNSVKHAEGSSAEKLRAINPRIFENPILRDSEPGFHTNTSWLYMPLSGDDLYVTVDDLKRYSTGIVRFWEEYISAVLEL